MFSKFLLVTSLLAASAAPYSPIAHAAEAKQSHLLALAACPPWKAIKAHPKKTKQMALSCQHDLDTIIPALRKSFAIDASNVTTRLNEKADFSGVTQAITALAARAKPQDRVVIYLNFHGGDVEAVYHGDPVKDEVLATYTIHEPSDFAKAVANNEWMSVKTLRDLVDQIQAREIVVVIEACESTAGLHDFRYDMARRYGKAWNGREAIIFSSRAGQAAAYNASGTTALFTQTFAKHLTSARRGNIRDIFEVASLETHRTLRATCLKGESAADLRKRRSTYADACTQKPEAYDPYGLLDDIQADGTTAMSAWRRIEDKKATAAAPAATSSASKSVAAANTKPSPANVISQKKKAKSDPFAWAKPLLAPGAHYGLPYGYAPISNPNGAARRQ